MIPMINYSERVLLTLWVGGMWIVGYLVTPVLFSNLDKQTAGQIAGQLFKFVSVIGLICGIVLLIGAVIIARSNWIKNWRIWSLISMLLLVAVGLFVLQPVMQELKIDGLIKGSEQATRFGQLHGLSSVLYLLTSILGLLLVLFRINPR